MKIIKYKKMSNNRYKVTTDDSDLILYEDVILKYGLLIKKEIDISLIDSIISDNSFYQCYYDAINSIRSRIKSRYEINKYLINKNYDNSIVDKVILKLDSQGYINDNLFTKSFINNSLITTNNGPGKIRMELEKRGISSELFYSNISLFSKEDMITKINKLIDRSIKSNRNKGGVVLKNNIYNYLLRLGYDSDIISSCLSNYSFDTDLNILEKEEEKLRKKYSKKYSGYELELVINRKLYQKGLKK